MKWFKHDTDANHDAKLKKLRIKYGMEGYGLYWYCLELIAADVDKTNITFELEHDSEIISHDTGIHIERINEMMAFMCNLQLFESNNNTISCMKMAKRLDQSMTSNPEMRKIIDTVKNNHDGVMIKSCKIRLDKIRLDKKESKPDKKEPLFKPPSFEEIKEYVRTRNSPVSPDKFYDFYHVAKWFDSNGKKVKNWKQKLITWEGREKKPEPKSQPWVGGI